MLFSQSLLRQFAGKWRDSNHRDDAYELYVNGRQVATGNKWQQLDTVDITRYLVNGRNSIAIKADNVQSPDAALVARVIVKGQGGTHIAHITDDSWKTSLKELPQWNKTNFDDREWLAARVVGPFGTTKPWFDEVLLAGGGLASRFKTQPEFEVQQILSNEQVGSVICLAFNEFGELLASREDGGLMLYAIPMAMAKWTRRSTIATRFVAAKASYHSMVRSFVLPSVLKALACIV